MYFISYWKTDLTWWMFAASDSVQESFYPPERSVINNFLQYSRRKTFYYIPFFLSLVTHVLYDIQGKIYCIIGFCWGFF